MKCGYCDTELEPTDTFCPSCGKRVDGWAYPDASNAAARGVGDPRKPLIGKPYVIPPGPVADGTLRTQPPATVAKPAESGSVWGKIGGAVIALIVLALVLTQWDSFSSAIGRSHTVNGSLILMDGSTSLSDRCIGTGGYDNVYYGAGIVIFNEKNEPIATGELGPGRTFGGQQCRFEFVIEDVPKAKFYTIEISGRGGPTNSYAQMEASNWNWDLTLG